jgi:predicted transcriptional regulator
LVTTGREVKVTKKQQKAISSALEAYPGTLRGLAREAGVDHSLLVRIRSGERTPTADTVHALLCAFAKCRARCEEAEAALRAALEEEPSHKEGT